MSTTATFDQIYSIVYNDNTDPFSVLGIHKADFAGNEVISVRCFSPSSDKVFVIDNNDGSEYEMERVCKDGFFEKIFTDRSEIFPYSLKKTKHDGSSVTEPDKYSFLPFISEEDLYLYNTGKLHKAYDVLGAHIKERAGVKGVLFAVWAPTARRVGVVGDFNSWDAREYMMRRRGSSGIWELFVPNIEEGELYKYEILSEKRQTILKMDPFAFSAETAPHTASYIYSLDGYGWNDSEWMEARKDSKPGEKPMSIYEVHLGSWMRTADGENRMLPYGELARNLVSYVKDMGYTHIELLPIAEHPFTGSWGYQVTGYYAPTCRYGEPDEFMNFVDICHQNGISVIMDWVPAHFPKDEYALSRFDGTCLYEHEDPRQGEHRDWGTLIFNYGRSEVKNFLISNALFWMDKYHIDGIRVDAVASMLYLDYSKGPGQWIPNRYGGHENLEAIDFLKDLNTTAQELYPGTIMTAEESTAWPMVSAPAYRGGLGFGFKWNMGWMNDMLRYMAQDPLYRKYSQGTLTFSIMYAFSENFVLPLSHDEVVHGKGSLINKMPGDIHTRAANLKLLFAYMFAHPGKKMLFQGSDFGQTAEWNHDKSIDWHLLNYEPHRSIHRFTKDLLHVYKESSPLWEVDFDSKGFEWIDFKDSENSVISFMRKDSSGRKLLIAVFNFTPVPRIGYRIGVPAEGFYREILNSDASVYGGSNIGNMGGLWAEHVNAHERDWSISASLPPLGAVYFTIELPEPKAEEYEAEENPDESAGRKVIAKKKAEKGRKAE